MTGNRHDAPQPIPTWTCGRVRDELDGWALGALEAHETAAVKRHLASCYACAREASRASRVASLIPFSLAPVSPSAHARQSLMARIAEEQMAGAGTARHSMSRPATATAATIDRYPRYHWSQVLVAPLAIALLVMSLWSLELRDQMGDANDSPDGSLLTTAMLPDGVQTFAMKSECERCQTAGTLLADPERADALMLAWDLDPSEVHQVWCEEGDGSKAMVANLDVSESGEVMQPLLFDHPISGYSRIYVVTNDGEVVEINMDDDPLLDSPTPNATERR